MSSVDSIVEKSIKNKNSVNNLLLFLLLYLFSKYLSCTLNFNILF